MSHTKTPHADFYCIKGLTASTHPELVAFLTEAERRYASHEGLVKALERIEMEAMLTADPLAHLDIILREAQAALAAATGQP